jgi:hypothetical protein
VFVEELAGFRTVCPLLEEDESALRAAHTRRRPLPGLLRDGDSGGEEYQKVPHGSILPQRARNEQQVSRTVVPSRFWSVTNAAVKRVSSAGQSPPRALSF